MINDLAAMREVHGITQQDLATRVGTSRQTIISIERGKYDPGLRLAMDIARSFDVAVEDLFHPDLDN